MLCNVLWLSLSLVQVLRSSDFSTYPQHNVRINTLLHIDSWLVCLVSALFLAFPEVVLSTLVSHPTLLVMSQPCSFPQVVLSTLVSHPTLLVMLTLTHTLLCFTCYCPRRLVPGEVCERNPFGFVGMSVQTRNSKNNFSD